LVVYVVAAERFPVNTARPAVQSARQIRVVATAECHHAVQPPEWRELQLYD
jgi:hypothetical protein